MATSARQRNYKTLKNVFGIGIDIAQIDEFFNLF
jgi:hypothetical protein